MNDPKKIRAWSLYDWANSAYSTTVVGTVLQSYLVAITPERQGPALWGACITISAILSFVLAPILGGIADATNIKKKMWTIFMLLGSITTVLMFFITPGLHILGAVLAVISSIGFSSSFVFYNAFLPEIASNDKRDRVSSLGFAMGYLGGGVLLALNLALILGGESFGIPTGLATRISLASAGLWWLGFSIPMLRRIHDIPNAKSGTKVSGNVITAGFKQLASTLGHARQFPQAFKFLIAFILFNDGVQSVIGLAATFGTDELKLGQTTIIGVFLMVQFLAFAAAWVFGRIAEKVGAMRAIKGSLVIWTVIVTMAYLFVREGWHFWALGAAVAMVLGGTQAISRSLFSQLVPRDKSAEFFGLYETSDKASSIFGPLIFTIVFGFTQSVRGGILALIIFFLIGLVILGFVRVKDGIRDVAEYEAKIGLT